VLLYGTTDKFANIHGPNERVLVDELEKAGLAEVLGNVPRRSELRCEG
jgi:acetylornithine deacetylase/succinyl-diaminopimelate desuccinylase-like protein